MTRSWMRRMSMALSGLMLVLVVGTTAPRDVAAQAEYVIGPDDVLQVSVFMKPELERTVTVTTQGNIVFPPIGEIKAAGLTTRQLADRMADRLSTYLRTTATVTVTVKEYFSRSVVVSGAVSKPGRYGFVTMPGLLDVINQAGGAQPDADLSRVVVVRREAGGQRQLPADLAEALQTGSEKGLPVLQPGDVVIVPGRSGEGAGGADAAGILGEVGRPGLYSVGAGQDLWIALAQAGGPTPRSNLSGVRVLSRNADVRNAVRVNLKETLDRGYRTPFIVHPGDIVFVDSRGPGFWSVFVGFLGVTRDVANLIALVEVLKNE